MSDVAPAETEVESHAEQINQDIESRIAHILEVHPYISRSMLQVAIGPGLSPKFWDPVFQRMIESGTIKLAKTTVVSPGGRELVKEVYHLPKFPYPPIQITDIES